MLQPGKRIGTDAKVAHKPSSVPHAVSLQWGDDHSSRITVTRYLKRPNPRVRDGQSRSLEREIPSYLVLLLVGFT